MPCLSLIMDIFFCPSLKGKKSFIIMHTCMHFLLAMMASVSQFLSPHFFNLYFFYYLFNFFTEIIKFLHYKLHLQVIYIFYLQQLRKKNPTPSHLLPKVINDPKKCDMYKLENSPLTCFYDNPQKFIKLIF